MDFHFYNPQPWSEILPLAPEAVRDLISKLIRYESSERLEANAVRFPNLSPALKLQI